MKPICVFLVFHSCSYFVLVGCCIVSSYSVFLMVAARFPIVSHALLPALVSEHKFSRSNLFDQNLPTFCFIHWYICPQMFPICFYFVAKLRVFFPIWFSMFFRNRNTYVLCCSLPYCAWEIVMCFLNVGIA